MRNDPLPADDPPEHKPMPRAHGFRAVAAEFASTFSYGSDVPEYARYYFDTMSARFKLLPPPESGDPAARKAYADAKGVVDTPRDDVTWEQLLLLELALTRSLSFDELLLRVADLRHRLADAPAAMPEGLAVKLDSADAQKDLPRLRAEADALVTRAWLARMARNARDAYVSEIRRNLVGWLVMITVVFVAIVSVGRTPYAPLYLVIITAGMLGALISIVRRLQNVITHAPSPDHGADLSALAHEKRVTVLSMLSGAVFAIVLYALFVAGVGELGGNLTPAFSVPAADPDKSGLGFSKFVTDVGPADAPSYAKVIVWSFVAGFFEQFVPDVLDRIAKRKQ